MSSAKEYRDFILEHLQTIKFIECKPMMGEYLLYSNGILFGGIYDNQLLIKKTIKNATFGLLEVIPYKNSKPMYLIEDINNHQSLESIISTTCNDLAQFRIYRNKNSS